MEATLFRTREPIGKTSRSGSLVIWRQDRFLSGMTVAGLSAPDDRPALRLAARQQERVLAPTPYTEAERDDTEVALDDPNLKVPVYWLGRNFAAGNDLVTTNLETATAVEEDGLPGAKLILRYDVLNLETWTRRGWKRFQDSFLGRLNRPPCTRTTAFEWEQGHARISAGYRRRTFEECPQYPPTRYWAVAHIGGVVIGVNQTTCRCLSPGSGPTSLRGMKAILRGLGLRPKPTS
jgi:hypothetical protein